MKLFKKLLFLVMLIAIVLSLPAAASAKSYDIPDARLVIFGKTVPLDEEPAYMQNTMYIPLRAICESAGAAVNWNSASKSVVVQLHSKNYEPSTIIKNNKAMVSVAAMQEILNCSIDVYPDYNVIAINKKGTSLSPKELIEVLPTYRGYNKDDLEWLAKIVHAEARGENYPSKLAVANVIINRTLSGQYPSTIKAVIFDKKSGVQFTPTVNGSVYNTPSDESYMAALEALEGKNNAGNALFFINPKIAKSSWVSRNREYAFTMGNHNFYN